MPGFYNIDNYSGVSGNFGTRGYWNGRAQNSNLAILVNGVPQMRPDLFATPMEGLNVPVEAIDRIEISQGPNGVVYGNGAFFGVINIVTNGSLIDDQFTVSTGANGTHRMAGRVSEFGDDYQVMFNFGYGETDGYDYDLLDMVGPVRANLLPFFGVKAGNTSLDGRLEQSSSFMQVAGTWRQFYFDFSLNEADVEAFSGFPAVVDGNMRSSEISRYMVGADIALGEDVNWDTKFILHSFDAVENYDALAPGFVGVNSRNFDNDEVESLFTYRPSSDLSLVAGVNWQRMRDFLEYTNVPALGVLDESVVVDERDLYSLFGQLNFQVSDAWRVVAGYRRERMGKYERLIYMGDVSTSTPFPSSGNGDFKSETPRYSIIYQPSGHQVFKLMLGEANKIPSFNLSDFDPEQIRTEELNYTWTSSSMLVSVSLFRNSLSELFVETLDISDSGLIETNLSSGSSAVSKGVDILLRKEVSDTLSFELGANFQDSTSDGSPDGALSYSPEWVAHGKLSYRRDHFSCALIGRYVDEMQSFYNRDLVEAPTVIPGYFGDATDDYFLADLNLRWNEVRKNVFFNLHVSNVFDTQIRYPNNPLNGLLLDRGTIGPGRRVSVKAGLRF